MTASTWWNPYTPLTPQTRRWLGVGAILTVLALWALVAGAGFLLQLTHGIYA